MESGEPEDDLTAETIEYCQKLGSKATKASEIISSKDKAIYAAIQAAVSEVNKRAVSNAQKIQKWIILEKDFSVGGGELGEWGSGGTGRWSHLWVLDRQHKQSLEHTALWLWRCCVSLWEGRMVCPGLPALPDSTELSGPRSCAVCCRVAVRFVFVGQWRCY